MKNLKEIKEFFQNEGKQIPDLLREKYNELGYSEEEGVQNTWTYIYVEEKNAKGGRLHLIARIVNGKIERG